MIEAVLLHQRGELRAEAAGARRFVHDHAPARLFYRVDVVQVEWPQVAQVDDLGVDTGLARGRFRHPHHRAVGDDGEFGPSRITDADSSGTV